MPAGSSGWISGWPGGLPRSGFCEVADLVLVGILALPVIIALILVIALCQFLNARTLRSLSSDEKALVVDAASGRAAWPLIGIAVIYGVRSLVRHHLGHRPWLTPAFMVTMLVLLAVFFIWEFCRLARLRLPRVYVRRTGLTYLLLFFGIVALFAQQIYHDWVRNQL
ncbi:MAG: hypothetical protein QOH39_3487 [Verrucomicrobiota bacterium]|jgi:hypothetical protein